MENNPKKSRALIITIVAVLILGIALYFLFKNKEQIFGAKTSINIDKVFAPLLGTSKPKDLNTVNNGGVKGTGTAGTQNNGGTTGSNSGGLTTGTENNNGGLTTGTGLGVGTGINGGSLTTGTGLGTGTGSDNGVYSPALMPLPTPENNNISVCQDSSGNIIDCASTSGNVSTTTGNILSAQLANVPTVTLDAYPSSLPYTGGSTTLTWTTTNNPTSCTATGGWSGAKLKTGYHQLISSITTTTDYTITCSNKSGKSNPSTVTVMVEAAPLCPDDPLYFTQAEHSKLLLLLKQFYLIAPTLKSQDDIDMVNNDMNQRNAIVGQAEELTQECEAEKADPAYTGPRAIKGNPYYNTSSFSGTYLPGQTSEWFATTYPKANSEDYTKFEEMFYIW